MNTVKKKYHYFVAFYCFSLTPMMTLQASSPPALTHFVNLNIPQSFMEIEHNLNMMRRTQSIRERMSFSTSNQSSEMALKSLNEFKNNQEMYKGQMMLASADSKLAFIGRLPVAQIFESEEESADQLNTFYEAKKTTDQPVSFYLAPFGSLGDFHHIKKQNGFFFHSLGGLLGFDYAYPSAGIGLQIGYERFDADVRRHWGSFDIDSCFGKLYGTFLPFSSRNFFLDLNVGYTWDWYKVRRKVGAGRVAKGKPDGFDWNAYGGIGNDFWAGRCRITPFASVEYVYAHISKYKEHGGGDARVKVGHQHVSSVYSWLGMSIGGEFEHHSNYWLPEIRGFWQHRFGHKNHSVRVNSVEFDNKSHLKVYEGHRDYGVVGAELRYLFAKYCEIAASYDFYWSDDTQSHLLYGELGFNW